MILEQEIQKQTSYDKKLVGKQLQEVKSCVNTVIGYHSARPSQNGSGRVVSYHREK